MPSRPLILTLAYYAAAVVLAAVSVGPALWLAAVAFSGPGVPMNRLPAPSEMTTQNFADALNPTGDAALPWYRSPLLIAVANSVIVTAAQTVLNVTLAAMAAFPLARMKFRGRDTLFVVILATLMIPEQVLMVPLFRTVVAMNLYDTLAAVVIPFSVSAFGIYLCRQAFLAIPLEVEEAARIDGAGAWRIWWHVMLPLAAPTLATLAVFSMISAWSGLLWPLIVLQDQGRYTLPVAINQLTGVFATNVRAAYAASVLALIPMVVMYLAMQKWLTRGLLAGAVKG